MQICIQKYKTRFRTSFCIALVRKWHRLRGVFLPRAFFSDDKEYDKKTKKDTKKKEPASLFCVNGDKDKSDSKSKKKGTVSLNTIALSTNFKLLQL